ncbi:MAG: aminodeoxychorismate/anthranilate synthase component II [Veillonella sp.]|uniref:anthranilate synthase component II n=1 Tax=Veillonella sp. TaxID=1926307 RepID=UPI0025DF4367|nr:aminodeoxychorismate/anthranilate synthase component II [Veillonella sp.]MBS4913066.1 aminodeoxychorismate/anthranilate synthase component II [Veillonella sp.]
MILLIDNYDSFSFNLFQLMGTINSDIKVIRSDELTVDEIMELEPDHIVLSPGPGRPDKAGVYEDLLQYMVKEKVTTPLLGVCLGHQALGEALGATVSYAKTVMHGKSSMIRQVEESPLFTNIAPIFQGARYHSLAIDPDTVPDDLVVTAQTDDGEIMAMEHKELPIYGLQFHPESILTPEGEQMMRNFLAL